MCAFILTCMVHCVSSRSVGGFKYFCPETWLDDIPSKLVCLKHTETFSNRTHLCVNLKVDESQRSS